MVSLCHSLDAASGAAQMTHIQTAFARCYAFDIDFDNMDADIRAEWEVFVAGWDACVEFIAEQLGMAKEGGDDGSRD